MASRGKRGGRKVKVQQQEPSGSGAEPHESLAVDSELVGLDVLSWMTETVNFENSGWQRSVATAQLLREQNKQLRSILPEGDGRDAQTVEELREQRQAAVKVRNEQLLEALKKLQPSRQVDLCFVVDATGSMEDHIKGVKNAIRQIVDILVAKKGNEPGSSRAMVNKLRLGFVAYRDYDYRTRFEVLPFSESVDAFHKFCSKLKTPPPIRMDDAQEDVLGGLDKALSLDWSRTDNTKVIFHICDAPAHGKHHYAAAYPFKDNYPAGDPDGLTADGIFGRIANRGIDYHFGKITEHTETMIRVFSDALGQPIDQFDVRDVQEISSSVISAVSQSVGNALSQRGASSRPERSYRIDARVPANWDALPVQSGKFLLYQLPKSIEDVANGVPLERCRPEIASVQIAAHPFARGGERIAYYGRDLKANKDIVLKEYRHVTGGVEAGLRHEFANQQQTIATFFAAHFMAACEQKMPAEKIPASLDFLMTKTLALGPMDDLRYMCVEPRLDLAVRYLRFTNNHDFVLPETCAGPNGISIELLRFVVAFSHYTYTISGGKAMVVDLQGTITLNATAGGRPIVLLTDPAIHSEDRIRFGATNHSKLGMKAFFEQHHCNEYCEALQLPKVDAAQILRG